MSDFDDVHSILGLMRRTAGFLQGALNNEVAITYPSGTTEVYTYQNGATVYMAITLTYSDSTKASITSAKRTT